MAARLGGWVPAYSDLTRHEKTLRVADLLRLRHHGPQAVAGYLVTLWNKAAAENTPPAGGPLPERSVEHWAEWEGKRGALLAALVEAGYIERRPEGLFFHDWEDGGGRVVVTRQQTAARLRRYRERTRDVTQEETRYGTQDVHRYETRLEERRGEERSEPPVVPQRHNATHRHNGTAATGGALAPGSPEAVVRAKHAEFHETLGPGDAERIRGALERTRHVEAGCVGEHAAEADRVLAAKRGEGRVSVPWRYWWRAFENALNACGPGAGDSEPDPEPVDWAEAERLAREANMGQFIVGKPRRKAAADGA